MPRGIGNVVAPIRGTVVALSRSKVDMEVRMRTHTTRLWLAPLAAAIALAAGLPGVASQHEHQAVEEFTAAAINTNRPNDPRRQRPTTAQLRIRIERWSTDQE